MVRLIRLPEVMALVGLSRSVLYEKIANQEFPAPFPLSENGRAVAWSSLAVEQWITERIARGPRTAKERMAHRPKSKPLATPACK